MSISIKNMHYDYKQRLNKLDSNSYKGLQVPQIDRKLNEALNLFILLVAQPRIKNQLGFETIQRTIDDIRTLVEDNITLTIRQTPPDSQQPRHATIDLPDDYLYFISVDDARATRDDCEERQMEVTVIRHNDRNEQRDFYKSNFDWGEMNIRFYQDYIKAFVADFNLDLFRMSYIKVHPYIHNAEDFNKQLSNNAGTYNLPDGTALTGYQDCILPEIVSDEIVDLAVFLTTSDIPSPLANQLKQNILKHKQLIN